MAWYAGKARDSTSPNGGKRLDLVEIIDDDSFNPKSMSMWGSFIWRQGPPVSKEQKREMLDPGEGPEKHRYKMDESAFQAAEIQAKVIPGKAPNLSFIEAKRGAR